MRWIAASLLAINILTLVAQFLLPQQAGAPAAARQSGSLQLEGDSLSLLSELEPGQLESMLARKPVAGHVAPAASEPELCTMVGPFAELLKAEYFVERLAALDVAATVDGVEVPGEVGYWIYLPPRESRKQAYAELRELQAKGIDSYVIPKGELARGISFGMFSQPRLARNRLEDMRSRGYAAELKEVQRSSRETWVVVQPGHAGRLSAETWLEMLAENGELERRQNFCPAVASR